MFLKDRAVLINPFAVNNLLLEQSPSTVIILVDILSWNNLII